MRELAPPSQAGDQLLVIGALPWSAAWRPPSVELGSSRAQAQHHGGRISAPHALASRPSTFATSSRWWNSTSPSSWPAGSAGRCRRL